MAVDVVRAEAKRVFAEVFPVKIVQLNELLNSAKLSADRVSEVRDMAVVSTQLETTAAITTAAAAAADADADDDDDGDGGPVVKRRKMQTPGVACNQCLVEVEL